MFNNLISPSSRKIGNVIELGEDGEYDTSQTPAASFEAAAEPKNYDASKARGNRFDDSDSGDEFTITFGSSSS